MDVGTRQRIQDIYHRNNDMVYRICFLYLKNEQDAYDAAHETFVRLIQKDPVFSDREHEKAWLIRVAVNCCKDVLKSWWKKNWNGYESVEEQGRTEILSEEKPDSPVLEAVLDLPVKYRTLVYLHYYEGYTVAEIGRILHQNPSTLRGRLARAKEILRKELEAYVSRDQNTTG